MFVVINKVIKKMRSKNREKRRRRRQRRFNRSGRLTVQNKAWVLYVSNFVFVFLILSRFLFLILI